MKERPILFSTPMVQAILDGRKTQTRRIVKPQVTPEPSRFSKWRDGTFVPESNSGKMFIFDTWNPIKCPYGQASDRLWVRETTWECINNNDSVRYVADGVFQINGNRKYKKVPSIFMSRCDSRITLEIVNVRVERLQDISEKDAIAEGISGKEDDWDNYLWHGCNDVSHKLIDSWEHQYSNYINPVGSYSSLWEKINGVGSWESNPWVFVIEFKKI